MTSSNVSPNRNHDICSKECDDMCVRMKKKALVFGSFELGFELALFKLGEWYLIYTARCARISDVKNWIIVNC